MSSFKEYLDLNSVSEETRIKMAQYIVDGYAGRSPSLDPSWTEKELRILRVAEDEVARNLDRKGFWNE